jgi:hypothetical protein
MLVCMLALCTESYDSLVPSVYHVEGISHVQAMVSQIGQVPKLGCCNARSNGVLLQSTCWFVCWHFVQGAMIAWYLRYNMLKSIWNAYAMVSQIGQVVNNSVLLCVLQWCTFTVDMLICMLTLCTESQDCLVPSVQHLEK